LTGLHLLLRKEHVISGLYIIPARALRTTRKPLGILTGSRTYARASNRNPGISFFGLDVFLEDVLKLTTRIDAWSPGEFP